MLLKNLLFINFFGGDSGSSRSCCSSSLLRILQQVERLFLVLAVRIFLRECIIFVYGIVIAVALFGSNTLHSLAIFGFENKIGKFLAINALWKLFERIGCRHYARQIIVALIIAQTII